MNRRRVPYLAELWQADVHTCPEASAQVGGTREDVAQMLVPHELPASLLDQMLHLWEETRCDQSRVKSNFMQHKPFKNLLGRL